MGAREALAGYHVSLKEFRERSARNNEDYFRHPAKYYVTPFRIADDLWYVGDARCCVHLLDTHDGLILFDSGIQHTVHLLIEAIWEAGFRPQDVRYILHSHGHYDHFGAANDFHAMFGTKNCLSAADAALIRENPARTLLSYSPCPWAEMFEPDLELRDGDILRLGDQEIRCVLTPSHTPGTMTFFFRVTDRGRAYRVGYFGGIGFLSVYRDFLREYGLPETQREDFFRSLRKVYDEPVDIVLGNHPSQNSTLEKLAALRGGAAENPFIDPNEWRDFLDTTEEALRRFIAEGY